MRIMYKKAKRKFIKIIGKINRDLGESFIKTAIVVLTAVSIYFVAENTFISLGAGAAVAVLLFDWDSRFFIAAALIFLLACPFWLAAGRSDIAEQLAIYAYFMMAVGIILHIAAYAKKIFLAKKKKSASPKVEMFNFAPAKTLAIGVAAAILCAAVISGGGVYFAYVKMHKQFAAEIAAVQFAADATTTVIREVAGEKIIANESIASADWETVKVRIRNNSGISGLDAKVIDDFIRLGCKNVTSTSADSLIYESTLVRYCPSCLNIAQELLATLKSPTDVLFVEDAGLSDEIAVILGGDQSASGTAETAGTTPDIANGPAATSLDEKNSV